MYMGDILNIYGEFPAIVIYHYFTDQKKHIIRYNHILFQLYMGKLIKKKVN